jgi:hypothetical protein
MALINCPECGNQISDTAKSCPHCGYILKNRKRKTDKPHCPQFNISKNKIIIASVLVIVVFLAIILIIHKKRSNAGPPTTLNDSVIEQIEQPTIKNSEDCVKIDEDEQPSDNKVDYESLYKKYVREHEDFKQMEYRGWMYAFIDNDDIPELVIFSEYESVGSCLLTIANGQVKEDHTTWDISYIPRKNRIKSFYGQMGEVHDYIEYLKSGKLQRIADIERGHSWDDDGGESLKCFINGKEVSESEADKKENECFNNIGKSIKISGGDNLRSMEDWF